MKTHVQDKQCATRNVQRATWLCLDLGTFDYKKTLELQHDLVAARKTRVLDTDILLLVEHPAVFTLGRRGGLENLIVSRKFLDHCGIPVIQVERGGDITYHGPGQLIAYPIADLEAIRLDVNFYVESLEEVMIQTALEFGVDTHRSRLNRGIWVGCNKMGSIGIAVRRGVSFHGLALNINLSLEPFSWIHPCGLENVAMTSLQKESKRDINMQEARQVFLNRFKKVFEVELVATDLDTITRTMTRLAKQCAG
ncbi:MAG: lipoyl(octanoyl) transferase LipB [Desulfobacterales bacterium]|jgi:lipoate-protein ligase B